MREKDIEQRLRNAVRELGGVSYKWTSPGQTGVPDRIVILPGGNIWFIELKTDIGRMSKIQQYQHKRLRKLGCNVITIFGIEELEEWITQYMTHNG